MKIKKNIPTKQILKAFIEERELWLKCHPQSAGALGCMFGRILNGNRVKNKKNGIEINIPEWLVD